MEEHLRSLIYTGVRRINGSVLLYGPPGCGKTILVQAAANEANGTLYSVRPSDILSKYQGESERYIRYLFEQALKQPKSIIFFDEFDSIAVARGAADDSIQSRRLLSEILLFLSKLKSLQNGNKSIKNTLYPKLSIIAATNRLEDLDEAIVRRFDTKIYVGPMNKCDRQLFIYKSLTDITNNLSVTQIEELSEKTNGWSGSDIEMLCREAAIIPLRKLFHFTSKSQNKLTSEELNVPVVTINDFVQARLVLQASSLSSDVHSRLAKRVSGKYSKKERIVLQDYESMQENPELLQKMQAKEEEKRLRLRLRTVVGTIVAYILVPMKGLKDSIQIASALCARHIGGAVNFVAVAEILQISPDVVAAAMAADNLLVA
eukprot:gene21461-27799_t